MADDFLFHIDVALEILKTLILLFIYLEFVFVHLHHPDIVDKTSDVALKDLSPVWLDSETAELASYLYFGHTEAI